MRLMRPPVEAATLLLVGLMLANLDMSHGAPLSRGGRASSVTRLPPDTNIAEQVAANENGGGKDVTYKIEGLRVTGEGNQRGTEIKLDLHETSALDESTTYSVGRNGESKPVGLRGNHILVSDARISDTVAIVSVNVESGTTSGIIQGSQGNPVTLRQARGRSAEAREADDFSPPDWTCDGDHTIVQGEDGEEGKEERNRKLFGHGNHHEHIHDHDHDHDHDHEHHLHDNKVEEFYEAIGKDLRGSKPDLGRRLYLTDSYPQRYTYQVDMYIEIDQKFVDQHGSPEAAIDYVDVLVSGANIIYEHEIDTHLHVAHIALTDLYDSASSTSNALNIMVAEYGGSSWHSTGIDLHHALLGNNLGGGIAYLGVLCNSQSGFGLSASLSGNFVSLDAATVWDMKVFAHELGHNFDSRHTHDTGGYSPQVDTCGTSCPSGLVTRSATLMSYCHQCGGYSTILYTFGGDWMGNDRSDMSNWRNNPELEGTINTDPRRVSMTMYEHVSTRGSCLDPTHAVPLQICSADSDCDDSLYCNGDETCDTANGTCVAGTPPVCVDNDACTLDLCNGASCYFPPVDCDDGNVCTDDSCDSVEGCKHQLLYDCCGNGICEDGEDSSSCSADCGPFELASTMCSSCYIRDGNMFDVEAVADIDLTSLTFRTYQGSGTVEVWTRPGSYSGYQYDAAGWTKIATKTFSGGDWAMVETPDFVPSVPLTAGSKQAFYVTHTTGNDLLYTGGYTVGSEVANDGRLKILAGRSANYQFGSGSTGNAWNGIINYAFQEEATDAPTSSPTEAVTTSSPTEGVTTSTPTEGSTTSTPTEGSTTSTPTKAPTTSSPTEAVTTSSPTEAVTTSSPTEGSTTSTPTEGSTTSTPTEGSTTSTPTKAPTTSSPSANPSSTTSNPSKAPTTSSPSATPTKAPTTSSPTANPTRSPTTSSPTANPTRSPITSSPTANPTRSPTTSSPTANPTRSLTTSSPTANPTRSPTTGSPTEGGKHILPPSCYSSETLNLYFEGRCNYDDLVERMEIEIDRDPLCTNQAHEEVQLLLGIELSQDPSPEYAIEANEQAARDEVKRICDAATASEKANDMYPFGDISGRGAQFDKAYFDGNSIWNEEYETNVENRVPYIPGQANNRLDVDGRRIDDVYEGVAEVQGIEFPDYMSNFENCALRAAMCCWVADRQANDNNGDCAEPYDTNCVDADPSDNTDICYVDMGRTPADSAHVQNNAQGAFALYDGDGNNGDGIDTGEGPAHCHGLAWGVDLNEPIARYIGNNLFYVSMSDHLYDRGYVRNVPGAPMCGCLETMPVVSRSDCTQLDVTEFWIFSFSPDEGTTARLDPDHGIEIDFNSCQGARNRNNDLEAYYERLRNEGRATDEEFDEVQKIIVGNGGCPAARDEFVETMGFEPIEASDVA